MGSLDRYPSELGTSTRVTLGKIVLLLLLSGGIICSHYLTPAIPHDAILHDIYRRILYLPIILAAFWYGWRGGMLGALFISVAYFPHIYHDWGGDIFNANLNRTLEAVMYLIVGGITGLLIDRLRSANVRLIKQSDKLQETMRALTEKTREVFEAEEQLRQTDRLKVLGQLSTGLAHEIRNPLGSIRGAAEILGDQETDPDQRQEFTRVLIEETDRLDHVLRNFLEYARTQCDGRTEASCQLTPIIGRLLTLMEKELDSAKIGVETALPAGGLPSLAMDEGLLQQVLLNLMLNSIQAMGGGGTLRIEAGRVLSSNLVHISIADTGPGIPPALRGRIYDPFFTTKSAGTGLGLSIVQKIVVAHHGRIWFDEHHRGGARMVVELPSLS